MQQKQRLISVGISVIAMLSIALFGILGCGGNRDRGSGFPYDPNSALHGEVDGEKAFKHVENLVAFGSRYAGTPELEKSRVYIIEELEKLGWRTQRQSFETQTPEGKITFVNLIARFGDSANNGLPVKGLLCSHYDTKKMSFEFVGANDAGSSTGLLIELARVMAAKPELANQIELVFFDGEEAFGTNITDEDGLYGSRYYAKQKVQLPLKKRPSWGVLLDMVGDKKLNVRAAVHVSPDIRGMVDAHKEGAGINHEGVQNAVHQIGEQMLAASEELGVRSKFGISPNMIIDDHLPLNNKAGIPTIDIIDFDYNNFWHTPADTLDKISAESLETVGQVTMLLVEKHLLTQGRLY